MRILNIIFFVFVCFSNSRIYGTDILLSLTSTPECKDSKNGSIHISLSVGGISPIPSALPYPLPYDVFYVETNTGDAGSGTMNSTEYDFNFLHSGNYKITVYYNHVCSGEAEIVVDELLNNITVNESVQDPTCTNLGSILLNVNNASLPITCTWSNGATGTNLPDIDFGEYCYTIIDDIGCKAENCINLPSDNNCNISGLDYVLTFNNEKKGFLTLQAPNSNFTYLWFGPTKNSFFSDKQDLIDLEPGEYCVRVFCCDQVIYNNCYTVPNLNCELPIYKISYASQNHLGSISGSGSNDSHLTFSWTFNNNYFSSQKNISGLHAGQYCITIFCDNKFAKTECFDIIYIPDCTNPNVAYIENMQTPINICRYSGDLQVKFLSKAKYHIKVYLNGNLEYDHLHNTETDLELYRFYSSGNGQIIVESPIDYYSCKETRNFTVNDTRVPDLGLTVVELQVISHADCPLREFGLIQWKAYYPDPNELLVCKDEYGNYSEGFSNQSVFMDVTPGTKLTFFVKSKCIDPIVKYLEVKDLGIENRKLYTKIVNSACPNEFGKICFWTKVGQKFDVNVVSGDNLSDLEKFDFNNSVGNTKLLKVDGLKEVCISVPVGDAAKICDLKCQNNCTISDKVGQTYDQISFSHTVTPDLASTLEPEGQIILQNFQGGCKTGMFYLISENPNMSCASIRLTGLPINSSQVTISNLFGKQEGYWLYMYCDGCCERRNISVPWEVNKIIQDRSCFDPTIKLSLKKVPQHCMLSWSNGATNIPEIDIATPGEYCVTITCSNPQSSKVYCHTVPEGPVIDIIDYKAVGEFTPIIDGYIEVKARSSSNFQSPFSYNWYYEGQLVNSGPRITSFYPAIYEVRITDTNGCIYSKKIKLEGCNFSHPWTTFYYFNPATVKNPTGTNNGSIIFPTNGDQVDITLIGPAGYSKISSCCFYNLDTGWYYAFISPKGNELCFSIRDTFYLYDCTDTDIKLNYTASEYCKSDDYVNLTLSINGGSGKGYAVIVPNAKKINIDTYKGKASELNGKYIKITDLKSGCSITKLIQLYPRIFIYDYSSENPPFCQIDVRCGNKILASYNRFEFVAFVQTDPSQENCSAIFKCGNRNMTLYGKSKENLFTGPNGCFIAYSCEFTLPNGEIYNKSIGYPVQPIPCPLFVSYKYRDVLLNTNPDDDEPCTFELIKYDETGKEIFIKKIVGIIEDAYTCLDTNGNCYAGTKCTAWDNNMIVGEKFIEELELVKKEFCDEEYSQNPGYFACPSFFKKDPTKLVYDPTNEIYYIGGQYKDANGTFIMKYDTSLNLIDYKKHMFGDSNIISIFPKLGGLLLDQGIINSVITAYSQVDGGIINSTHIDGSSGILHYTIDGSGYTFSQFPFASWSEILSVHQSGGYSYSLIKANANLTLDSTKNSSEPTGLFLTQLSASNINSPILNQTFLTIVNPTTVADFVKEANGTLIYAFSDSNMVNIKRSSQQNGLISQSFSVDGEILRIRLCSTQFNNNLLVRYRTQNNRIVARIFTINSNLTTTSSFLIEGTDDVNLDNIVSKDNIIALSGYYDGSVFLQNGDTLSAISYDPIVLIYTTNGQYVSRYTSRLNGDAMIRDMIIKTDGNVVVMGCYDNSNFRFQDKSYFSADPEKRVFLYQFPLNIQIPILNEVSSEKINYEYRESLLVVPNPTRNLINVYFNTSSQLNEGRIIIYNMNGKEILNKQLSKLELQRGNINLNVSNFAQALYTISLHSHSQKPINGRFVKLN